MKTRLSKFLSMILIAALIMTGFTGFAGNTKASAAEDEIKVFVTIADDTGAQVVKQKTVEVTDVDILFMMPFTALMRSILRVVLQTVLQLKTQSTVFHLPSSGVLRTAVAMVTW